MILILCGINTSTIVWMVYNFIPSTRGDFISMWDVGVLKNELNLRPDEYLSIAEKGTIYFFMIIGVIVSACFIKWLFTDTIDQYRKKRERKEDKEYEKFKKGLK